MNSELEKKTAGQPQQAPKEKDGTVKAVLKWVLRSLRHNLLFKLLAVFLALLLWAGLISQDPTLIREKVFQDVQVSISGAETLKDNNLIVMTNLTRQPPTIRMKVDVPQKEYSNVTASNYNPRIDISRIRETGKQQVPIIATSTSAYGTVVEMTPDVVEVEVDEYITKYRVPVTRTFNNEYPNGYYCEKVTVSPDTLTVSGPKSLVDKVRRAQATFDRASIPLGQSLFSTSVPFELLDENDEVIESDLMTVTSESIRIDSLIFEFELYPTQAVTLSGVGLTKGEPAAGYEVKKVTVSPSTIRAAGIKENLEQFAIETLYLEQAVDLTGHTESFNEVIKVRRPSELRNLNPDSVTVSVEIGPKIIEKRFDGLSLTALDAPAGLNASADIAKASVKLSGPELALNKLKASDIKLTYSLKGLTEGTFQLPIDCLSDALGGVNYTFTVDPGMVTVTLKQK